MKLVLMPLILALAACGSGGDWVDAPQACQGAWAAINLADTKGMVRRMMNGEPTPERNPDLRAFTEEQIKKDKLSSDKAEEARKAIDTLVANGARLVCSNVGKSYTGDWECTAEQQRIKCK